MDFQICHQNTVLQSGIGGLELGAVHHWPSLLRLLRRGGYPGFHGFGEFFPSWEWGSAISLIYFASLPIYRRRSHRWSLEFAILQTPLPELGGALLCDIPGTRYATCICAPCARSIRTGILSFVPYTQDANLT
jgi:hypothetical protein